ncbi:LYR motif containing 1 [Phyllostomus discolor]|uniref:LYR motif containing 1 n=1 Tax=Phyllostomus discolor TaxID=89673 RepID=A0A834B8R8_9CHIR|nr:LYR motif containing 1 [Phyllostomus discolor]
MTTATRQEVLALYRRIFRLVRKWQAASGQMEDTIKEKQYILNEARMLFQKNKNATIFPRPLNSLLPSTLGRLFPVGTQSRMLHGCLIYFLCL